MIFKNPPEINTDLKKFLEDPNNLKLIKQTNFTELYEQLNQLKLKRPKLNSSTSTGILTHLLYYLNIDPLLYMTEIPYDFLDGTSIDNFIIPNNITSIGEDAFYCCYSLKSVAIPDNITSIGSYAFEYCSSLTSITIGSGVEAIGNYVFYGCSDLSIINYSGTILQWNSISKGSSWKSGVLATKIHCTDGDVEI